MSGQRPLAPRSTFVHTALNRSKLLTRIKKSSRACDNCRAQRRKCGGAQPCTGCYALGEECRYSGTDGRKRECWKAQITALELRNAYLEQTIRQLSCNCVDGTTFHTQQSANDYTLRVTQQGPLQSTTTTLLSPLVGSNAFAARPRSSSGGHPVLQTSSNKELERLFYVAAATQPQPDSSEIQDTHDQSDHLNMLPQEQISRLAIDTFFQSASTLFYVTTVEKSTWLLEKVYHTPNATVQDVTELCALAAIGSQYNTVTVPDRARAAYLYIASTRLNQAIVGDVLQGLRILLCLCMTLVMEKSLSARLLLKCAWNFARNKMLADLREGKLNRNEDDERRRTLRTLIFLEGWVSFTLGYQSSMSKAEINLHCITKLVLLASDIQHIIPSHGPDYWSHADMLFGRLDAWHASLPPGLYLTTLINNAHDRSHERVTDCQKSALYLMHLLYIDMRLQVYRQLIKASYPNMPDAGGLQEALLENVFKQIPRHVADINVGFAVQLARIASLMYAESAIFARCWLVMRSVFDAGAILLLAACQRYHSSPSLKASDADDLFRPVETCLMVLAFCSRRSIAASRLRDMLDPAFCHLSQVVSSAASGFSSKPRAGPGSGTDEEMGMENSSVLDGRTPAAAFPPVLTIANHILDLMSPGFYLLFLAWNNSRDDATFRDVGSELIEGLRAFAEMRAASSDYIYMNYAGPGQNPLSGYGEENFRYLVAMVKKYDPTGVFQTQCPGGWKGL
ncbi:hypothetical protein BJX62DRAFT_237138 [Aspergillus germanicus]